MGENFLKNKKVLFFGLKDCKNSKIALEILDKSAREDPPNFLTIICISLYFYILINI